MTRSERLRELAAWYREFAEKTENPQIWAARLRHSEILDAEARALARAGETRGDLDGGGKADGDQGCTAPAG